MSNEVDVHLLLIKLVEQHPILYDKSLPDYKNVNKKTKAWEDIASNVFIVSGKSTNGMCSIKTRKSKLVN